MTQLINVCDHTGATIFYNIILCMMPSCKLFIFSFSKRNGIYGNGISGDLSSYRDIEY